MIMQVKENSMLKYILTKISFQHQQERSPLLKKKKKWEGGGK